MYRISKQLSAVILNVMNEIEIWNQTSMVRLAMNR